MPAMPPPLREAVVRGLLVLSAVWMPAGAF
jgi:hypothetical protein